MILVEVPFVSQYRIYSKKNTEISADIYIVRDFVPGFAFEVEKTAVHYDSKVWGFVLFFTGTMSVLQILSYQSSDGARCWDAWCVFCSLELSGYFWSILVVCWSNYFSILRLRYLIFCGIHDLFRRAGDLHTATVRAPWEPWGADSPGSVVIDQNSSDTLQNPISLHMEEPVFQKAIDQPCLPPKYYVIKITLLPNELTIGIFLLFQYEVFQVLFLCQEVLNTSHLFHF